MTSGVPYTSTNSGSTTAPMNMPQTGMAYSPAMADLAVGDTTTSAYVANGSFWYMLWDFLVPTTVTKHEITVTDSVNGLNIYGSNDGYTWVAVPSGGGGGFVAQISYTYPTPPTYRYMQFVTPHHVTDWRFWDNAGVLIASIPPPVVANNVVTRIARLRR